MSEERQPISAERALHWHDISTMKPEDFGDAKNLPAELAELIRTLKPNNLSHVASVFIEHFDLGPPNGSRDDMVYEPLFRAAKEACLLEDWSFRSYSSAETPGVLEDFLNRNIKAFPTLILYRDGVELGRWTAIVGSVEEIIYWGKKLLVNQGVGVPPAMIPDVLRDSFTITEEGELVSIESETLPTPQEVEAEKPSLLDAVDHHMQNGEPMKIIYFGGGQPGLPRWITPLRYGEQKGGNHIIAFCLRSEMEKTFRLDRMHLPEAPMTDGGNDFRTITRCLNGLQILNGMLSQIARLKNTPIEKALAEHFLQHGEFESFFDEYSYGGFILQLNITSPVVYLSIGYDANDFELMHYHFTPESEPQLTPDIATHYGLYVD